MSLEMPQQLPTTPTYDQLTSLADELSRAAPQISRRLAPVRDRVLRQYWERQPGGDQDGHELAIVTAGVPGAGKSTAIRHQQQVNRRYRPIDADSIKDLLLDEAHRFGLLARWESMRLADGGPVRRRELAPLVHPESTAIADLIRSRCLTLGENFIQEGTLNWPKLPDRYATELIAADYKHVDIVTVEVGQENALRQAYTRWQDGRHSNDPRGGRFIPPAAITDMYDTPDSRFSRCVINARKLFQNVDTLQTATWTVTERTTGREHVATYTRQYGTPVTIPTLKQLAAHLDAMGPSDVQQRTGADHSESGSESGEPHGDVWVSEHTRSGRTVTGHWRRRPQ